MTVSARTTRMALAMGTFALLAMAATPGLASAAAKTVLVSQSSNEQKGNELSGEPSVSRTGRFVAFNSAATNLVPNDTNGKLDCFVRDRVGGTTTRISVQTGGGESDGVCFGPAISQDGRWVAFESNATDLGSSNGFTQIYLYDRVTKQTVLVSESAGGGQGGNGRSGDPAISGNGRFVVYESVASNLLPGGADTNGVMDVFVWDRASRVTKRVSVRSNGVPGNRASMDPAISGNGAYIAYASLATNLVPKDTNGRQDVFLHSRPAAKTSRVSINSNERQANGDSGNAAVSNDGRWVAFESRASNLAKGDTDRGMDVFLRDRQRGQTTQVSLGSRGQQGNGWSGDPTISNDGRYVAFESAAPNLVAKDSNKKWDAFVRDRVKRTTKIVSRRADGKPAAGDSDDPYISGNGRFIAFESVAPRIVAKDGDTDEDIFLRGPLG